MPRFAPIFASLALSTLISRAALADDEPAPPPSPEVLPVLPPPVAASPAEPPPPAVAPSPEKDATPSPIVELSADHRRATIERRRATSSPGGAPLFETGLFSVGNWEHACVAPCRVELDPRFSYRVAGDGLVPTDSFALPSGADAVRVDARMGSSTGRIAGVITTGAGALAIAAGGLALAASPILASEDVGSEGFRTGVLAGGIGAVSIGVVAATIGLYLWLSNGSSARTETAVRR
jgi:hypothetical protein